MLHTEIVAVYLEAHVTHKYTLWRKTLRFLMLKFMVHMSVVTIAI